MTQVVTATLEGGILKLDQPLSLPSGTRVRLSVEAIEPESLTEDEAWAELERLSEEMSIDTGGVRMTRDQLHERR
jgi:predicted DNA-binding antitoxin AbrB/MazE fold protein